jgi:hypothetical protein
MVLEQFPDQELEIGGLDFAAALFKKRKSAKQDSLKGDKQTKAAKPLSGKIDVERPSKRQKVQKDSNHSAKRDTHSLREHGGAPSAKPEAKFSAGRPSKQLTNENKYDGKSHDDKDKEPGLLPRKVKQQQQLSPQKFQAQQKPERKHAATDADQNQKDQKQKHGRDIGTVPQPGAVGQVTNVKGLWKFETDYNDHFETSLQVTARTHSHSLAHRLASVCCRMHGRSCFKHSHSLHSARPSP